MMMDIMIICRGRPEISPPVLINSTLNSVDLELHK